MQHSDYVSGYTQLGEVIITLSIHPQSFETSKQNFFDSSITELTSSGVKYTRAPLGARVKKICYPIGQQICHKRHKDIMVKQRVEQKRQKIYNFGLGFSIACGPFYQFQLLKDATALWGSAIYARDQAVISGNSLSDLCTKNSVSVSPLESTNEGKRHCGVFIDIPLCDIDRQATVATVGTPFYYRIPFDITFSGALDLNQLNPIFNSFLVLTRNYATLHQQLWIQDLLQDLMVVWLNKNDTIMNNHLTYHMIPPEKPEIVYLLAGEDSTGLEYLSQIGTAKFDELEIQNFFLVLFTGLNLIIDQNNIIPQPYKSLNQETNGQIGSKAIKTLYTNKYMHAWKLVTDDSFIQGYNSSMMGSRTNVQVIFQGNLTKGIIDTTNVSPSQNQNDFKQFIGTRAFPDPTNASIILMMHYLCYAFVRIIFDDSTMPQVLNIDVIGVIVGGAIKSQ
ncbi:MAG: hypothetical protein EZS28_006690 [Streblomastix strix]|uniref:Uncharacterized protein n=1 Tax=Streblomastix strix TaxID=222440 RepID=A0A5J4WTB6_9EUKA|nr:MAG: hypothetical protein EZS28_006690 [Streblomastix strix]